MNADEILTRTFAEHEGPAPDPETVLADIHARLARRRRAVPILAAAATVGTIVIGAAAVVEHQRPTPPPVATTPTPAAETIAIDTTWLPPGTVRTVAMQRSYGTQVRNYAITGADKVTTNVELTLRPGSELTMTGGGPPPAEFGYRQRDLTIAGRTAREWRNGTRFQDTDYYLVVRLPGDRVVQVRVYVPPTEEGRGAALATIGERVAGSLKLDRPEPIDTAFRPAYVPKGSVVSAVGRDDLFGTNWILTTPGAVPDGAAVTIRQDTRYSAGDPGSVVVGRPVQGHPTHVITDGATVTLWVDDVRPGVSIVIRSTHAAVPLDELYRIADGIRWTG